MDDYVVHFPNGYHYFYSSSGIVLELSPDELARVLKKYESDGGFALPRVGPDVDGYLVYPGLITGHVSRSREAEDHLAYHKPGDASTPGYFVIDLRDDKIHNGLSRSEWIDRLRKSGVNREPRLFKPSRFDEYLGHNNPQPLPD